MRIVVTGRSGQVVTSLLEKGAIAGHEVVALGRPELDLTNAASVMQAIETAAPDVIVSAAAYTAVDKAETEANLVYAVNSDGAGAVARAAAAVGAPLVHVSTDYVFDGALERPYVENDPTGPTGVYGASKLKGEDAILSTYNNCVIVRVAWVYSPYGANFVKTMLRVSQDREELEVVADQIGNPTSALDIADGIFRIAENLVSDTDPALRGIFHMTAAGEATWADFAEAIFAVSAQRGGPSARVRRISTAQYPTPATRPANSRLNCDRIAKLHGISLPEWQNSLLTVIERLCA